MEKVLIFMADSLMQVKAQETINKELEKGFSINYTEVIENSYVLHLVKQPCERRRFRNRFRNGRS